MSYPIDDIERVGPVFADRLKKLRIRTTERLLEAAKSPRKRRAIAEQIGAEPKELMRWVNISDMLRIKGIGEDYSELLEAAGVPTVRVLRHRDPKRLAQAMAKANRERKLVRLVPTERAVSRWVAEAKSLPAKVSY
jgi:predicted flap endonuclease-1-like 5' DNA nuclease